MEWKNIYRGMIMGASDVIPGVSGGTIAVLLGIYDQLIESINGFFSKEWKKHLAFLLPLGVGVIASILLLSHVIEWLFEHYPGPTKFFFLGLIIGILPYLFHKAEAKQTFKAQHILLLLIGAAIVASMVFFQTGETEPMTEFTLQSYLFLFFSGMLASSAMILPGISGSFVLLIIGVYSTIISAVSDLRIDVIAVVGIGVLIGIIVMSKIIHFFLENFPAGTYALVIGLVIGSIVVIFPGVPSGATIILSVVAFALGLGIAYILGKVEYEA
ncbi:DUF368 domain-containing protein [Radiobacillus deserti]|uniref:DUF368 domain-containing protein n=1 Tax=Radiobacillus deserti TaxID=2594883 RepID=A0A516KCJ6_9BACI|nr:DUF368 domain-containing protein [Radiobacillus deserti]QDP39131.1 DUF368 domain-containing protein [Radiobacillus deserti]